MIKILQQLAKERITDKRINTFFRNVLKYGLFSIIKLHLVTSGEQFQSDK